MTEPALDDALDLLPEAWAIDIAADAASQGCTVGYTVAATGLRTQTIRRVLDHFATREADADWQAMSEGQRLDECFPAYHGIGSYDLFDELGLATEYLPARPELSYPALIMDRHVLLWPV